MPYALIHRRQLVVADDIAALYVLLVLGALVGDVVDEDDAVAQTEIKTLKRFITFWVTVAGLVISIASTILSKITDFVWPR